LALASRDKARRWLLAASAVAGVVACVVLYQAADEGGQLVYAYGGGPGLRSGDPADVQRLLVAGLYAQAAAARDSGRGDEAARLTDELVRQRPGDPSVALLAVESLIRDRHDPGAALAMLDTLPAPAGSRRWEQQTGLLRSEALVAAGQTDSARAVLTALAQKYPESRGVQRALGELRARS
jgi:predicted Zn-dependent protease